MIDLATTTRRSLRVDECQELFGVSRRTIYHWIRNGRLTIDDVPSEGGWRICIDSVRHQMDVRTPPSVAVRVTTLHSQRA